MRLSEIITIYLAAGAPFGVSDYLHAQGRASRSAIVEAIAAALLWPLSAAAILFKRLRHIDERSATKELDARVVEAERAFVGAVNKMLEMTRNTRSLKDENREHTLYALRECVGQYVGLDVAEAYEEEGAPARHEMELARLSGLRGEDLLVAGRCAHRRNIWRVKARYQRARARLLDNLAALHKEAEETPSAYLEDRDRAERRQASATCLEIYERGVDLFSLLEDAQAARSAASLMYRERARLRSLQESGEGLNPASSPGEEKCTEPKTQLIYEGLQRETTFTQG